jgi:hypothetical protein
MYQRALPVARPLVAPGERLSAREQLKARTLVRAFIDQCLRLLRLLASSLRPVARFHKPHPGTNAERLRCPNERKSFLCSSG